MKRLACDRCREILARGGTVPPWAKEWWDNHQAEDAREFEESELRKQQQKIRSIAISKLTKLEREELGL